MGRRLAASVFVVLLLVATAAQAAPDFPELSGRVVDNAGMLDAAQQAQISDMLEAHEQKTGEQVVVVTLADLGGETIEEYGYQLGRHWGIGQKDSDNGALLIIAKAEHKIRIEAGYGLEGRLTDAQSSIIINNVITPAFRAGDFGDGITQGAQAMIRVLGGDPLAEPKQASRNGDEGPSLLRSLGFFGLMVVMIALFSGGGGGGGRGRRRRSGFLGVPILMGSGFGGGGGAGFGGGDGFSGGGGGFGGGGASGGW